MHRRAALAASTVLLMACASAATAAGKASLVVQIEGVRPGAPVLVALFSSGDTWLEDARAVRKATLDGPATGKSAVVWRLEGLPGGAYAARAFQDLDRDGELDKNWIGLPTEPFGFSRDAKPRLGPPGWRRVRFDVEPGETSRVRFELRGGPEEAEAIATAYERKHGRTPPSDASPP